MNRTFLYFLLAATGLAGCTSNSLQPDQSRLSGTITPAISGYVTVAAGPLLDSAKVNKNGTFSLDLPVGEPMKVLVFFGKQITNVHLEPGKELIVNLNPATFPDDITYEGALGPVNHYLSLANRLDQQTRLDPAKLFAMLPAEFIRITDSIKQLKITLLEEFAVKYKEIDPEFTRRTKSEFEFSWADLRIQYPDRHLLATGVFPDLPAGYHPDYLNTLNLNRAENLSSVVFKDFIMNYLDYKEGLYLEENPKIRELIFPESIARFRVIHKEFTDPKVLDLLIFQAMNAHLSNYGTAYLESFITDFRITCKNPDYVKDIETLAANLETISAGKPAPDFTGYTIDGEKVKISDYFGKVLYIGFWSSWSEWSLLEIPSFEQIRREFAGKEITFIMVSLDFEKDKNKWAATVRQNNLGGIQLIQDSKSTVLQDKYFLNDFPRYFLIGKDGKIISVFAPRPVENVRETLRKIIGLAAEN
jgi:alkyl hydroperoxide reductase subunit AhpC